MNNFAFHVVTNVSGDPLVVVISFDAAGEVCSTRIKLINWTDTNQKTYEINLISECTNIYADSYDLANYCALRHSNNVICHTSE